VIDGREVLMSPIGLKNALDDSKDRHTTLFGGLHKRRRRGRRGRKREGIQKSLCVSREHALKKNTIPMKRDRDFQDKGKEKIRGKKGKKGDQKGETWKEIDAQHRPDHQNERDKIQGLKHGFQKENFIVGFLFQVRV
jgi:hypothetical protein